MATSSPPSSPTRPVFVNKTNDANHDHSQSISHDRKRPLTVSDGQAAKKRVRIEAPELMDVDSDEETDSDDEDDLISVVRPHQRMSTFGILQARMTAGPSSLSRSQSLSTRPLLQTYVSSNKADVFTLHSVDDTTTTLASPPYACSYAHAAKRGESSLLAVSTEEGVVHILDASKRQDWDVEPQRRTFQHHGNGVFDVQWSPSDTFLATAAADRSICISRLTHTGAEVINRLQHHTSTVKCISWDPTHDGDIICSGSRDGMICVWDLRIQTGLEPAKPVIVVNKAHDTARPVHRRTKLSAPPARGVTSLLFSDHKPCELISSGTYDGVLRLWDLRCVDSRRGVSKKAAHVSGWSGAAAASSSDPTSCRGTSRPRGITSMSPGSGVTAGLIFALSNDSHIHTYDMASLEPLSGWSADPVTDAWSHGHEKMRTNSFYVRLAISPCGRWLASGGAQDGSAYLFDVSNSTRARVQPSLYGDMRGRGIELNGQKGEVGAVDWAAGSLATCADDGTVRVWRPDLETYRKCEEDPEEMAWGWSWAKGGGRC